MKNVKFKLKLNSKEFAKEIKKRVEHLENNAKIEYLNCCDDIQKHFEMAKKLLNFLNFITCYSLRNLKNIDAFFAENYKFDIRQEASLFQEIATLISKADFYIAQYALEHPCYWPEIYDYFKFSEKQKDVNFLNLNYYLENAYELSDSQNIGKFLNINVITTEGTSLGSVYDLSCLILIFGNYDEVINYIKSVQEIKDVCNDIKRVAKMKKNNDERYVSINDDEPLLPF